MALCTSRSLLLRASASLLAPSLETVQAVGRRTYVMWPSEFEDPVANRTDFPALRESGEYDRKRLVPVKSALDSANCSVFSDPLVLRVRNTMARKGRFERVDRELRKTFHRIKAMQIRKLQKASEERRPHIVTDPERILHKAVENARPLLALQRVRVGAVVYSVPAPITTERSIFEGIRWLMDEAKDRDRTEQRFYEKFADLLVDTATYTGKVVAKKHEHHRVCEQNRAYAHYRSTK